VGAFLALRASVGQHRLKIDALGRQATLTLG
jgi:hypothetical protein